MLSVTKLVGCVNQVIVGGMDGRGGGRVLGTWNTSDQDEEHEGESCLCWVSKG